MIEVLIAGERDPQVLAELAKGVLRRKIGDLALALSGRFGERHGQRCRLHLRHLDYLSASITDLDARIRTTAAPFRRQIALLMTIPGIGERLAQVIVAKDRRGHVPVGKPPRTWPPGPGCVREATSLRANARCGRTRHGNLHLQAALVEAVWAGSHTASRLAARFRRLHRRFGKSGGKKAAVAVAHTLVIVVWHLLARQTSYTELGVDYYMRRDNPEVRKNQLVRQLRELGYHAELSPAA